MKTWLWPTGLFARQARRRSDEARPLADGTAAIAVSRRDPASDATDVLLREIAAAALLVAHGVATRVVVCNAPVSVDLDEVRLIADRYDVRVEPVVRVGGGGLDFAVSLDPAYRA